MADKKQHLANRLDHIRTLLLHEPRGRRDMLGAPTTDQADYGTLFIDSSGLATIDAGISRAVSIAVDHHRVRQAIVRDPVLPVDQIRNSS